MDLCKRALKTRPRRLKGSTWNLPSRTCHHSLGASASPRVPMTRSRIRSRLCLLTERGKGNPSTWGAGRAQNRKAQTRSLGPVKRGFHHSTWQEAWCVSCEIPVGLSDRLRGRLTEEGGARYVERGRREDSAPAVPGLTHRGYNEERKGPVFPASHSSQNRLEGQSHEVSRWNQESRRAKARTLSQSCFSRVKATAPFPPNPTPQPARMGLFELSC